MADQDIKIAIATTADTSGAEAVKESILGVEDAAKQAERELDVLEAKSRKENREKEAGKTGGLLGADVSSGTSKLGQAAADYAGFGQQFRVVSQLINADAVAVTGSVVGIGAAAAESYHLLDETVTRWREFEAELKSQGKALPQEIADQIATIEATIGPVRFIIDGVTHSISEMWKVVHDPAGELSGLNALEESLKRQKGLADDLKKKRLDLANETGGSLSKVYHDEAEGLKEQEETLKRIAALRGQLQSIEQRRADRQIKIAQQDGGDVALAEANALAVSLKVQVAALSENLRQSQAAVTIAQQAQSKAFSDYSRALKDDKDKLDPEAFKQLGETLDKANKELQKSQSLAGENARLFSAAKVDIAEEVEVAMRDIQDKYKGAVSKEADTAFKGITESLKTTIAEGPQAVIENIKVEVGTITTAATTKADEVKSSLDTERTGTVAAIAAVTPTPQDTAAITGAIESLGKAITDQGNAMIAALTAVTAVSNENARRMDAFTQQIQFLLSRTR